MLNAEMYKKEILKLCNEGKSFAINKDTREVKECKRFADCYDCIFYDELNGCIGSFTDKLKWLYSEYKDPIMLTEDEYDFCRLIGHGYLVKFKDYTVGWHEEKPHKSVRGYWETAADFNVTEKFNLLKNAFSFIKCTDAEPYSIRDILQNYMLMDKGEEEIKSANGEWGI